MKIFSRKVFLTLALLLSPLAPSKAAAPPYVYAFHQQHSAACYVFPWINYHRLQQLRVRQQQRGGALLQDADFIPKIWSSSLTFVPLTLFYESLKKAREEGRPFATYYHQRLTEGLEKGTFLTEDGDLYHRTWGTLFRPVERLSRLEDAPFEVCIPTDGCGSQYHFVPLPLLHTAGGRIAILGDVETRSLVHQPSSATLLESPEWGKFYADTLQTHRNGFNIFERFYDLGERVPFELGLYRILLLLHGIDEQNQRIEDDSHPLSAAYHDAWRAVEETEELWEKPGEHPYRHMKPEIFFEHRLATVFRENPRLKAKFKGTLDFCLNTWRHYESVYHPHHPGEKAATYMPHEDLILAFYVSRNARFLYAAAVGQKALITLLEVDNMWWITLGQKLGLIPSAASFRVGATRQKPVEIEAGLVEQVSFMDAWEELLSHLNLEGQKDWVSFSGHGAVLVFDEPEFHQAQTATKPWEDQAMAERLRFSLIDSYYAEGLEPFYRRRGTARDVLEIPEEA